MGSSGRQLAGGAAVLWLAVVLALAGGRIPYWLNGWRASQEAAAWLREHSAADELVFGPRLVGWLAGRPTVAPPSGLGGPEDAPRLLAALAANSPRFVLTQRSLAWQYVVQQEWFTQRYGRAAEFVPYGDGAAPYLLWRYEESAVDLGERETLDVMVDGRFRLVGFQYAPETVRPGEPLAVAVQLQATKPITHAFQTIVQLISPLDDTAFASIDVTTPEQTPLDWWEAQPGQTITERFVLTPTAEITAGAYQLNVAFRGRDELARYPMFQAGDTNPLDRVTLDYVAVDWTGEVPPEAQMVNAALGERVWLRAAEIEGTAAAGAILNVTLFWEGDEPEADYVAFVHLLTEAGEYVAGYDDKPQGGRYATLGWKRGNIVPDLHPIQLPADLAAGNYQVTAGLYVRATGERLAVRLADGSTPATRAVPLAAVMVP